MRSRFVPEVHNKYLRCKRQVVARQKEAKLNFVGEILESGKDNMLDDRVRLLTAQMEKNRRRQMKKKEGQRGQTATTAATTAATTTTTTTTGARSSATVEAATAAAGVVFVGIFVTALVFLFGSFYAL